MVVHCCGNCAELIPDLIRAGDTLFCGVLVARRGAGIHLAAIRRAAARERRLTGR